MKSNNENLQLNSKLGSLTFALFIAGYILVSILGQLLVGLIFGEGTTAQKAICACFSSACILAIVLFYVFFGNHKTFEVASVKPFKWWYVFIALLLSCGMFLGLGFVNESIAKIIRSLGLKAGSANLAMPTFWHFLVYTVSFAILPAIFEEVLFRGILLNCFAGMKKIVAVLISALIFALYHHSFTQLVYQFIYGVALSYLALSAKSIIPCIISHFVNNFSVVLLTYLQVSLILFEPLILVIGANALACFGAIIFFIQRKEQKVFAVKGEVKSFFLPLGLITCLVCIALAINNLVG